MKKMRPYIVLHLVLCFYSLGEVCSKLAAGRKFLSLEFCLFYGLVLLILGVYALLWQQILKSIPLNIAYANRVVTLIWSMLWGQLFFREKLSASNIIGAVIVLAGVLLMITGGERKNE